MPKGPPTKKVLLVKMSSLGDVVHLFPALTDACRAVPGLRFDWVVEGAFAPIARLHPAVLRVLPIELRQWRRSPWRARAALATFRAALRAEHYDLVLDAQGLIKSAVVSCMANGPRAGFGFVSAREPLASAAYGRRLRVERGLHAIDRLRRLMAMALEYPLPSGAPEFGLVAGAEPPSQAPERYLLFLHGTTWRSKQWPEHFWRALCQRATAAGWSVRLAFATPDEQTRACRVAEHLQAVEVLRPSVLADLLPWLAHAGGVVSVDTGLGHVAAALGVPTVMLYGPTSAQLTGGLGARTVNLQSEFACAPCVERTCRYTGPPLVDADNRAVYPACFASLSPNRVWSALMDMTQ